MSRWPIVRAIHSVDMGSTRKVQRLTWKSDFWPEISVSIWKSCYPSFSVSGPSIQIESSNFFELKQRWWVPPYFPGRSRDISFLGRYFLFWSKKTKKPESLINKIQALISRFSSKLTMESSAFLSVSQISFCHAFKSNRNKAYGYPTWPCNMPRTVHFTRFRCQKMYVPGFGEASPEAKAANNLHHFFTYIAVRIVAAQLQSYNPEAYEDLMEFLGRHSLNDGDKFCANLMRESSRHQTLALRILEVRSAYCKNDFEWDNVERLAKKMVGDSNTRIMRDYVLETSSEDIESER